MTLRDRTPQGWTVAMLRLVTIDQINGAIAYCTDERNGKPYAIDVNLTRAKGLKPKAGDRWIIDRILGRWSFAAVVEWHPPIVTGDRSVGTALTSLLAALSDAGVIDDQTVP